LKRSFSIVAVIVGLSIMAQGRLPPAAIAHTGNAFAAGVPGDPAKPFRVIKIEMREEGRAMSYVPNRIEVKVVAQSWWESKVALSPA